MDFVDEKEVNPLFHKNLEMRAKVQAINAATRKALPSIEDTALEDDECEEYLSREQIITRYVKSKENVAPLLEIPKNTPSPANDDLLDSASDNATPVNPSKERIFVEILSAEKSTDHAIKETLPEHTVDIHFPNLCQLNEGTRRLQAISGEGDCVAAQGDGYQCGPSKDEMLMTELIKRVSTSCGEYLNPITGETMFLEEGDIKSKQDYRHVYSSSGKLKKEKFNLNKVLAERAEHQHRYIDLRSQSNDLELSCCEPNSYKDNKENESQASLSETQSPSPLPKGEDLINKNVLSENETLYYINSKPSSVNEIPRACFNTSSLDDNIFNIQPDDLSDDLTKTIFKIKSPEGTCESGGLNDETSDFFRATEACTSAPGSAEECDTVDRVWDWVTAIPRSYYLEDDYLPEFVSDFSNAFTSTLNESLLGQTFRSSGLQRNRKECHSNDNCQALWNNENRPVAETDNSLASTVEIHKESYEHRDCVKEAVALPYTIANEPAFDSCIAESLKVNLKPLV